ncbi:DMT family transporter [Virgibacillus sp. DJP39]|uniref:DMT family transporter n=1 Tax=Virgibacillus sp. DJP39 TaxID=3409790 RepID=UPI003BB72B9F
MLKAYSWLTFCIVMWGSNFIFGKILVQDFSPNMLTMLRLVVVVLLLVGISFYRKGFKRVDRDSWFPLLCLGVVGVFINQWSFFYGLQTADTTISALILAIAPILTGFLAGVFLKESITLRMIMGSIVAIIGIYIVVTKGRFTSIYVNEGLLWIVLTMISFAVMIIITRVLSRRIDPLTMALYSYIIGLAVSIPFAFTLDNPIRISADSGDWVFLIGTTIAVHGIATLIWNENIRYVDASKASMLSNLEPFVAMIVGVVLLFKPITFVEIIGSLVIVSGVILSTYQRRKYYIGTVSNK